MKGEIKIYAKYLVDKNMLKWFVLNSPLSSHIISSFSKSDGSLEFMTSSSPAASELLWANSRVKLIS